MSTLHPAANRPGNRGRLILRMLLDGAPSGLPPIDTATSTPTTGTLLLAADSPDVGMNGARLNGIAGPNFSASPLPAPAQN